MDWNCGDSDGFHIHISWSIKGKTDRNRLPTCSIEEPKDKHFIAVLLSVGGGWVDKQTRLIILNEQYIVLWEEVRGWGAGGSGWMINVGNC